MYKTPTSTFLLKTSKTCYFCDKESLWLLETETPLCTKHFIEVMDDIREHKGFDFIETSEISKWAKRYKDSLSKHRGKP